MAVLALAAVAAAVAGATTGTLVAASIAFSVASVLGGLIFRPKGAHTDQSGPRLGDLRPQNGTYGAPIPFARGYGRFAGNVIWARQIKEVATTTTQTQGGKGGSSSSSTTTAYTYFGRFAVGVCENSGGVHTAISKIWCNGKLIWDSTTGYDKYGVLAIHTGTETQIADAYIESFEGAGNVPAYRGTMYVTFADLPLADFGNALPNVEFLTFNGDYADTLADQVAVILKKGNLTAADYDLTALAALAPAGGLIINRSATVRQTLQQLTDVFFFDLVEVDAKIKAVIRGGGSLVNIPEGDLATTSGQPGAPPPKVDDKRMQSFDLPRRLVIHYQSAALDYQQNAQSAMRLADTQISRTIATNEYTVVMTEESARQVAQKQLYTAWLYRQQLTVVLPPKYIKYCAADVVTINADGFESFLYVTQAQFGGDNLVTLTGLVADEIAFTDDYLAGVEIAYTTQVGTTVEPSTLLLFDAPLLRNNDDTYGFYIGSHGTTNLWRGDVVYKSADDSTFQAILAISTPTIAGAATTTLADAPYEVFDRTNTVRVALDYGRLSSVSEVDVLNGKNIAMLGSELIGFATATLISTGVYDLSDLVRGIQGSDWATGSHTGSDTFILLANDGSIESENLAQAEFNVIRFYKGVTNGQSLSAVVSQSFASTCVRIKPLAGVFPVGARDVHDNLNISWTPRARVSAEIIDGADTGTDEDVEAYDIDIMSGVTVLRTIRTYKPSAFYGVADQVTDGFTPGDPVTANIYQLSNRVGRGYVLAATL